VLVGEDDEAAGSRYRPLCSRAADTANLPLRHDVAVAQEDDVVRDPVDLVEDVARDDQ